MLKMKKLGLISRWCFGIIEEVDFARRRYALKTFASQKDILGKPDEIHKAQQRFIREVRIQRAIKHRNIMPIVS